MAKLFRLVDDATGRPQLATKAQTAAILGVQTLTSTKTSNYTAVAGERVVYAFSFGPYDIKLPAAPVAGDIVSLVHEYGIGAYVDTSVSHVTVDGNGKSLSGSSILLFRLSTAESVEFQYNGVYWMLTRSSMPVIQRTSFASMNVGSGVQIIGGNAIQAAVAGVGAGNNKFTGVLLSATNGIDPAFVQTDGCVVIPSALRSGTWNAGIRVYLDPSTPGSFTVDEPAVSGDWIVPVGWTIGFDTWGQMMIDRGEPSQVP